MKLTSIKRKIFDSIRYSIHIECMTKTNNSISDDIWWKIREGLWVSNESSIEIMQITILSNLQNTLNEIK